jgi:hypothetical protein
MAAKRTTNASQSLIGLVRDAFPEDKAAKQLNHGIRNA